MYPLMDDAYSKTINGVTKTQVEHWSGALPRYANYLRTWGEAGTVKMKLIGTPKVADRGTAMMFVGYATKHDGDTCRIYNPATKRLVTTRDIIWLRWMYYTEPQDIELTMEPAIVMEVYKQMQTVTVDEEQESESIASKSKEGFTAQGARVQGLEHFFKI